MGVCTYTLVHTASFTLDVTNEHRNGVTRVSYLKDATLTFYHPGFDSDVRIDMNREDGSRGQAIVRLFFLLNSFEIVF